MTAFARRAIVAKILIENMLVLLMIKLKVINNNDEVS